MDVARRLRKGRAPFSGTNKKENTSTTNMTKHTLYTIAALALAPAPALFAGTTTTPTKTVVEKAKESFISGDLGVAVVSQYISRGVVNENQGFIAQPYLDIYIKMYEGDGFLNKIQLNLGFWASLHSNKTFAAPGSTLPAWYEFDWMPGLSFTFAKNFTFTATYLEFDFVAPNARAGNLNFNLAYDDTDLLGGWALKPHVAVFKSLFGNPVGVPGANQGWYYEIGIAPTLPLGAASLTFPINVGLGDDKFYGGDTFGYFSAGANLSVPLAFIPEGFGKWTLSSGVTFYSQGDNAAAASAPAINDGGTTQWVFSGAVGMTF